MGSIPSTASKEAKLGLVAHTALHWLLLTEEMWYWHSQLEPSCHVTASFSLWHPLPEPCPGEPVCVVRLGLQ